MGIYGHAITHPERAGVRSQAHHRPRGFVAEDHGLAQLEVAHAPLREIMQVRAADSPGAETDDDLVRGWRGFRPLLDREFPGLANDAGFHEAVYNFASTTARRSRTR